MTQEKQIKSFMAGFRESQKEIRKELKKRFEKMSKGLALVFSIIYLSFAYVSFRENNLLAVGLFLFIGLSQIIGFVRSIMIKPVDLEEKIEKIEEQINLHKETINSIIAKIKTQESEDSKDGENGEI